MHQILQFCEKFREIKYFACRLPCHDNKLPRQSEPSPFRWNNGNSLIERELPFATDSRALKDGKVFLQQHQ
jgi:hypothetical protein